jgi:hypothetical protein
MFSEVKVDIAASGIRHGLGLVRFARNVAPVIREIQSIA